jgi:ParB family chromosome partitioning protein
MPDIPLSKIHANPKNPRRVITLEMIENMAASLDAVGLKNDIKLNVLPDGSYELISGHIRFAAAQRLGWKTISAELLTLTPDEAELVGLIDNQSTQMHWLDWVLAMEKMNMGPGKLKQQQIADKLGVSQTRVAYALKLAKGLTPASRELIYHRVIKSGLEKAGSEKAVRALADLLTPEQVEKALPVLLDRNLSETQSKGLAKHVKAGNPPEAYGQTPPKTTPTSQAEVLTPSSIFQNSPKIEDPITLTEILQLLLGIAVLWCLVWLGWLAWKAVVWVIHLF